MVGGSSLLPVGKESDFGQKFKVNRVAALACLSELFLTAANSLFGTAHKHLDKGGEYLCFSK